MILGKPFQIDGARTPLMMTQKRTIPGRQELSKLKVIHVWPPRHGTRRSATRPISN